MDKPTVTITEIKNKRISDLIEEYGYEFSLEVEQAQAICIASLQLKPEVFEGDDGNFYRQAQYVGWINHKEASWTVNEPIVEYFPTEKEENERQD